MAAVTAARPPKLRSRPRLRALVTAPPEEVADGVWLLRGGLLRSPTACGCCAAVCYGR